ncbi:hypothetical protein P261_01807 [Lachnospiraceae bacterium TWA4]|nr:hypothetical protein P261_01807 [Lachnospiraceae bacterium TWA4]
MVDYLKSKNVRVITVDSKKAISDLGSAKILNVVLLGAAIESGILDLTKDDIKEAIKEKVNPKFYDLNNQAIEYIKLN